MRALLVLVLGLLALLHHAAALELDQGGDDTVVFDAPGLLGRVRGRRVRLADGRYGAQLIGLPYANQPVRRFEPATVWSFDGRGAWGDDGHVVWDATGRRPPPPCPQMADGAVVGDEQCLYANVFLPPRALLHNASWPLPVYVFIHGGAYVLGAPSSPQLDGLAFAAEEDVIVVTLAYRLGALGFLAHPAMAMTAPAGAQGNMGLLDLRVGLDWVSRYIHLFGGDPARVTLGGQSAGAYLACLLLAISEEEEKPFRGVILESGGCYAQPLALAQNRTREWSAEVGCAFDADATTNSSAAAAASSLACLRRLPLEALVPASTRKGQEEYHFWQPTVVGVKLDPASPLPAQPSELLAAGAALRRSVPVIAGTNEDEGTLFLPPTGLLEDDSDAAYEAWVRDDKGMRRGQGFPFLTAEEAEEVLRLYPPAGAGQNRWNAAAIIADAHYKCPTLYLARLGWRSFHLYRFAYFQIQCEAAAASPLRCYHGSELPYVFDHPRQTPCRERAFLSYEQMVADGMRGLWADFVRSEGRRFDPEKAVDDADAAVEARRRRALLRGQRGEEDGLDKSWRRRMKDAWPAFREGREESMLRFQTWNISMVPADRREVCTFWDTTRVYR